MGQAFSIDGSFISPLKATFSVYFSQICSLTSEWDEPVEQGLADEFKEFLKVIQKKLPSITPTPRCVVPPEYHPVGLDGHSDGSLYLSSWVIYMLSAANSNPMEFAAWVLGAAAKVKHHSVVGNEMLGIYLLTENITNYIFSHHMSLFRIPNQPFVIRLGSDSECCLYSLNPLRLNKSVLVKNAVRAIHSFCSDITTKWPHVSIIFYHTITSKNCSDSNSKIPVDLDPIRIMESRFWRNGLPEFLDPNWPPPDSVFLRVERGSFQWFKTKEAENVTNCVRCHNQICGTDSCRCLNCLPMKTGKSFSTLPSFSYNWPVLMKNLPLLAPAHLESLLKRRNITMAVRSIARFLSISLPEEILKVLNIPAKWYGEHLQSLKNVTDLQEIDNSEISTIFQKLAFLTIIKSSNATFKPSGQFASEEIGGIVVATMRYSTEGMNQVFKTNMVPIVSSKDKLLLYRLFQLSHIVKVPGPQPSISSAHLSPSLTAQRFKTGTTAVLFSYMRTTISKWVEQCPYCIRVGNSSRSFSHAAEDPRILSLLDCESPIYHCVSIDLFQDIWVLAHSKARGKPSYCVHILIVADLISKSVTFIVLDGAKMEHIISGLQQLSMKYRLPALILLDSGPQLRSLPDHQELTGALSEKQIKLVICPQGHQFSNFSERIIKEAKKVLVTLCEDSNRTIYRQPQTLLELMAKLQMVESVMSLRPILGSTKDQTQTVLTPRRITHPYLGSEAMNQSVVDILRGVFDPDCVISQLGRTGSAAKEWLRDSLLSYLQDSGIRFQSEKSGNDQKKTFGKLKPAINDIVSIGC